MWGWLRALVQGLIAPLVEAWQQYLHGRAAQQRDDATTALTTERAIHDALETDRADRGPVTLDGVRQQWERDHPAGDGGPSAGR